MSNDILSGRNEQDIEQSFSETEDTALKRFLMGSRIYTMLAAALIALLVFIPTFASIVGIYNNVNSAKNFIDLSQVASQPDLNGQYVKGSAYKFLAKLGYIAETEAAATHYYYAMYLDINEEQVAVLVEADKRGDTEIGAVIDAYLAYAQNPDAGYRGNIVEVEGRFKNMSRSEEELFNAGISQLGIKGRTLGYTLKIGKFPTAGDTVAYWFIALPFGIATVVCLVLFIYGLRLEDKRAKANMSPYPYLNKKKK